MTGADIAGIVRAGARILLAVALFFAAVEPASAAVAAAVAPSPSPIAAQSQVLLEQRMPSAALRRALTYSLYLPRAYRSKTALRAPVLLPVIYLLHGVAASSLDWMQHGHLQAVADALIAAGKLPPVIIVMPDAGDSWYVDSAAYGGPGNMATAIGLELPAWIEAHYRVAAARDGRAIGGYSMGGYGALRLAFLWPERWVAAAAMSGAFWTSIIPPQQFAEAQALGFFEGSFGHPFSPRRLIAGAPLALAEAMRISAPRPALYLVCGRTDHFHLAADQTTLAQDLRARGFSVETRLVAGDHRWRTWRAALPGMLVFLGAHVRASGPGAHDGEMSPAAPFWSGP